VLFSIMKKVLLVAGGWDGHQPHKFADIFAKALQPKGLETSIESSLDVFGDEARLKEYDVIFPCWTMGTLTPEQSKAFQDVVRGGVAVAGIHGGMGDAFRGNLDYEWMVGGHFVGHPHVGPYTVRVRDFASPITKGLPAIFDYNSEQYYMMMDPGVHVLADTEYVYEGRSVNMPVAWIRKWGKGRVFYSALGHSPEEFEKYPASLELSVNGILWAAGLLD
jgi:type 1 glutamine amidotransferase